MSHMDQVVLNRPLDTFLRKPIGVRVWTTAELYINFFAEYGAFAVDVLVDNLDGTNTLTVYLNDSQLGFIVAPGVPWGRQKVVIQTIRIAPNAGTGTGQLNADIIKDDLLIPSLQAKK